MMRSLKRQMIGHVYRTDRVTILADDVPGQRILVFWNNIM